jgi:hypothetical protein
MRRTFAAIVLVALLAIGGGAIANTAYQAGLSTAVTTAVSNGATVVAPVVNPVYGYGYGYGGYGPGFGFGHGIFGFFGTLIFLFLIIGLLRAVFFGGRHGRRGPGWGGHGWGGPGWDPESRKTHFESRFQGTFDDWHRRAHDGTEPTAASTPPTQTPPTTPAG